MDNIIIATTKEWNIKNYFSLVQKFSSKYNFNLITSAEELTAESITSINPKYIFFPHWSWIIPQEIYSQYECIVFHMTDLPFGRGGSPFQNLLVRGIYDTKVTALKVEKGLDTGDVYLKEPFNISIGSAEENFIQLSQMIFEKMIPRLLNNNITPAKQIGEATIFKRRTPEESNLTLINDVTLVKLYDFIRMLDAEGYPKAHLPLGKFKLELSEIHLKNNKLTGRFEVQDYE